MLLVTYTSTDRRKREVRVMVRGMTVRSGQLGINQGGGGVGGLGEGLALRPGLRPPLAKEKKGGADLAESIGVELRRGGKGGRGRVRRLGRF